MISVMINGVICPTVGGDRILINKRIVDIENPEQKTADWSQSFLIENTAEVNKLFGSIFEVNLDIQNTTEVNFTADFNPNLKASIVILNDNAVIFRGYCQMENIIILDGNKIQYSLIAIAGQGNFFNDIKNKTLSDLDLSDLNHTWTKSNIINSWTPTLGVGYVYPMIDYGLTTNYDVWLTTYFRPAVFLKDIIDRIFSNVGWAYSSAFFSTTRFKSLIIPFSAENVFIDNDEIYDRSFLVGRESTILTQTLKHYNLPLTADPIIFNVASGTLSSYTLHNTIGNDYNTTTGKWTCATAGNYKFGISMFSRLINNTGKYRPIGRAQLILMKDVSGSKSVLAAFGLDYTFAVASSTSDTLSINYTSLAYNIDVGDILYFAIATPSVGSGLIRENSNGSNIDAEIDINSAFSLIPQSNVIQGDMLDMNTVLPKDVKQQDLLMSIGKLFNLYFEQTDEKTLLIEPREDYFTSDTVDWTGKLDIGQDVKLTPMGMNQQKRYKFTYESDTDVLNKRYYESYQQVYGTKLEDIQTDFLTETKEIKPIFAATPLFGVQGGVNDRIISQILFADEDGTNIKPGQSKIRLLYWGGLVDCNSWTIYEKKLGISGTIKTQYPYAGHLDHPKTPTFDLCYSQPEEVYYDGNIGASGDVNYTDANIYNIYWRQTIKELTNKNSKVFEAMFNLSTYDFLTLSFRKQYFIKEAYYRLLEVIDYDIQGDSLVKCRLLKVDREAAHTTSIKIMRGGVGVFDAGGKLPVFSLPSNKDSRTIRIDKNYVGEGSNTEANDAVNRGTGNNVPYSANKSYIYGSDNVTMLAENAFVHNSDGIMMIRDGAMFNGVDLERKFEYTADDIFLKEIDGGVGALILPEVGTNEHYLITRFYTEVINNGTSYSWNGTGDITLLTDTDNTVLATVPGTQWLGYISGIGFGTTTGNYNLQRHINISIDGTWQSGSPNIRFIIFYKIITI